MPRTDTQSFAAFIYEVIRSYREFPAAFHGFDAMAIFALGNWGPGRLELELQGDYLWAGNTRDG